MSYFWIDSLREWRSTCAKESMQQLKTKLINQKNITVEFDEIKNANHSFVNLDAELNNSLNNYIQKESRLF